MANVYVDKMNEIITVLGGNSLVGPAGPQGPQGAAGPAGPQGPAGAAGLGTAGAVFPAAPATGAVHFRTDLGLLCYWDGARWLTVTQQETSLQSWSVPPVTVTGANIGILARSKIYTRVIELLVLSTYVETYSNGSNFWTLKLYNSSNSVIGAATTGSSDTYIDAEIVPSPREQLTACRIVAEKTGTPGALYVGAIFWTRLIIP